MQVKGSHQIVPFGDDLMRLYDSNSGAVIVSATREAPGSVWKIHAEVGEPAPADLDVPTRPDAVQAMVAHALEALGGEGYSTLVPHGLMDMP